MKIIVLVKEVPDTYGERAISMATGLAERDAGDRVLDEVTERALEVALAHADDAPDTEVIVLSMAAESATSTVRKGLAMGANAGVQIVDPALRGADLGLTAQILAAGIRSTGFDLVIAGNQSTDGMGGVVPAMLSELLEVPHATNLTRVDIVEGRVTGVRASDGGSVAVAMALPAIISVTERLPDARFPNFKSIMAAKKKPFDVHTAAGLGVDPEDMSIPRSIVVGISQRPPRGPGRKITDEGSAGNELAGFLIDNGLA